MLRLRLLGGLELIGSAGQTVNFVSRKDAALLAFLAMRDHPVDRSEIADLLWGDRAEEQARKSLSPHYAPRMSNHRLAVAQSFGIA